MYSTSNGIFPDQQLLGQFRTFGDLGPAYKVLAPVRQIDDGDWLLRIQVIETGEELDYRYTHALGDPKAN